MDDDGGDDDDDDDGDGDDDDLGCVFQYTQPLFHGNGTISVRLFKQPTDSVSVWGVIQAPIPFCFCKPIFQATKQQLKLTVKNETYSLLIRFLVVVCWCYFLRIHETEETAARIFGVSPFSKQQNNS